ncbi:MAG: MerR family transcriptional regulator [Bacteroidetes bacterium]|nr:MerR family transcriptional regulator [Bacteroidota bacterium]
MPLKDKEIEKMFYSIGEVAEMFQVNTSLIRYYENEFEQLHPAKSTKGNRQFTKNDIETLKLIFQLINENGYTIPGARNYLKANYQTARAKQQQLNILTELKQFLIDLKGQL